MSNVFLTTREKQICPKIRLKTKAKVLNDFVKATHNKLRKEKTEEKKESKNKLRILKKINKTFKKSFGKLSRADKISKKIRNYNYLELATTKDLSRILGLIEVEGRLGLSDITRTARLKPNICKNALSFLTKHNILKEERGARGTLVFSK